MVEFIPADFLAKFARLIPPARVHLVRYHGALGPRSPLRGAVTQAARERANFQLIRSGMAVTGVVGVVGEAVRAVKRAMSREARSWAACLGRIFAVDVSKCAKCGGEMRAVAVITEDGELDPILAHLDLDMDFPKAKVARSPPRCGGEDTQVDPAVEAWEGIDEAVEA